MRRLLLLFLCGCGSDFNDPDIQPPANVTDLAAAGNPVVLTWTNPTDADLARVWVRRKTGGYPVNHADGDLVFENASAVSGAPETFTDTSVVSGETYYYAVFSVDDAGN